MTRPSLLASARNRSRPGKSRHPRRQARHRRLMIEPLEDRRVLSLATAINLGDLIGETVVTDDVGPDDPVDYFRFMVTESVREVTFRLEDTAKMAWVELIEDRNSNWILDSGEVLGSARTSFGLGVGEIPATFTFWLDPGMYFVRIRTDFSTDYTPYTLTLAETPKLHSLGRGDNTLPGAHDLGVLSGALMVEEFVGPNDAVDFFRFTVTESVREVTFRLEDTAKMAWVELIEDRNSNWILDSGEVLGSARTSFGLGVGEIPATFTFWLDPGMYFVRIRTDFSTDYTPYTLTLAETPQLHSLGRGDNTLPGAHDLGVLSGALMVQEFVGPNDAVDFFRFTVTESVREVTFRLEDTAKMAWVELIEDRNSNWILDSGEVLGSARTSFGLGVGEIPATFTFWLDPGMYFVRIRTDFSTDYTPYTLTLAETPKLHSLGRGDNTLPGAHDLGVLSGALMVEEFVGPNDEVDFFRFTVTESVREVTFRLEDTAKMAWVELIEDRNSNWILDSGEVLGSARTSFGLGVGEIPATFTFWLDPGMYFVRIRTDFSTDYTPYTLTLAETPKPHSLGRGDNTLPGAHDLGVLNTPLTVSEFVGTSDELDYFRFTVTAPVREVSVWLSGLQVRGRLELIEDRNSNLIVDLGEILAIATPYSGDTGTFSLWLDPGVYYVRVQPNSSGTSTPYTLTLAQTPKPHSLGRGDNILAGAHDLGVLNSPLTVSEFVGTSDELDYFRFTVTAPVREVSLWLSDLQVRGRLELIEDANRNLIVDAGEVLATATPYSGQTGMFSLWLDPGAYYIRVQPHSSGTSTPYTLTLAESRKPSSPGRGDNTLVSAFDLGILNTTQVIREFVGTSDPVDHFRFTLTAPARELTVRLEDLQTRGRVELIHDANNNYEVDSGEVLASATPYSGNVGTFNRWLDPGPYYVRVQPHSGDTSTSYTLTLAISHQPLPDPEPGQFERTGTGFIFPTGRSGPYAWNMPGWLAGGPSRPAYQTGYYHLGTDMDAPRGAPVYAIADGEVVYVSTGGWGAGNYGLFVRHRLENGEQFLALYGHVRPSDSRFRLSSPGPVHPLPVRAGEIFATIGPADGFSYYDDHLHFGIRPSPGIPPAPFGRMPLANWPQTNGFVDPLAFLHTQRPSGVWTSHGTSAPRGLTAVAIAPNQTQLTWQASSQDVTGVQIERRSFGQAGWEFVTQLWGNVTSFVDQAINASTSYYYRVRDWMGGMLSGYSNETSITTPHQTRRPEIFEIQPAVALADDTVQVVTIRGRNFLPGVTVMLTRPDGEQVPPLTTMRSTDGTAIVFTANFDTAAGEWKVEVKNLAQDTSAYPLRVVPSVSDSKVQYFDVERFLDSWEILYQESHFHYENANLMVTEDQETALEQLLLFLENDPGLSENDSGLSLTSSVHQRWAAYMLATVWHETARPQQMGWLPTWSPVPEVGKGQGKAYGTPHPVTGHTYYGRGYVQLTWIDNYAKFSFGQQPELVGIPSFQGDSNGFKTYLNKFLERTGHSRRDALDLVSNPELALTPEISYAIMSFGMREGKFTIYQGLGHHINNEKTDFFRARLVVNTDSGWVPRGDTRTIGQKLADWGQRLAAIIEDSLPQIVNGIFRDARLEGWGIFGTQFVGTIPRFLNTSWAQLTAQSPVALYQAITTPDASFSLSFDHQFVTTTGTLDVLLDSVVLASINAPTTVPDDPSTFQLTVTDPLLFGLEDAVLAFRFDGPTDSQVLISNIVLTSVASAPTLPEDIDDVGPVDVTQRTGVDLDEFDGERWFRLETVRPGLLSLTVRNATEPETLQLTLYETVDGEPLLGTPVAHGQRIVWEVSAAGEVYYARLTGAGMVDLRLLNSWLWASPDPITRTGDITLSTIGVEDAWGPVVQVEFYHNDQFLGSDEDDSDGWSWTVNTDGWALGEHTLSARALDADDVWSALVTAFVTVENSLPQVDSLVVEPDLVARPGLLTLSASGVSDPDGHVVRVEFYRGEDLLGEADGSEDWTWSGNTAGWASGEHLLFARAQDNDGAWSDVATAMVTIVNAPPVLTTIAPLAGAVSDEPFSISYAALLAASDASDPDGEPISFRVETVTSGMLTMNGEPVTPGETLLSAEETWVWTPADGASGVVAAFTVVAWDGEMASSPAVAVQIIVDRTLDAVLVDGTLSIVDIHPDGQPNSMTVRLDGSDLVITDANEGFAFLPAGGELSDNDRTLTIPLAWVTSLVIDLAAGDDVLTVDFSGGNPIPVGGLSYDGGAGEDLLGIVGSGTEVVVYTPSSTMFGDGTVDLDGRTIAFTGLEPTDYQNVGTFTLSLPGSDNVVDIAAGALAGSGQPALVFTGSSGGIAFESAHVRNTANVILDTTAANDGDDMITISGADNDHGNTNLSILTGDGDDTVRIEGNIVLATDGTLAIQTVAFQLAAGATIAASGTGAVSITALKTIALAPGSSITAVDGDLVLSANQQATPPAGEWMGITLDGATISTAGTGGIRLAADSIELTSTASVNAGLNEVVVRPRSVGTRINFGGEDVLAGSPLTLGLSADELGRITAGTLTIGDADSGRLTITALIVRSVATDIQLISGEAIVFDPGSIDTAGGHLQLSPGTAVQPLTGGTDLTAAASRSPTGPSWLSRSMGRRSTPVFAIERRGHRGLDRAFRSVQRFLLARGW
jgi:murein DD-endopeptidase MepM/ murein hydrolase activator NlpD